MDSKDKTQTSDSDDQALAKALASVNGELENKTVETLSDLEAASATVQPSSLPTPANLPPLNPPAPVAEPAAMPPLTPPVPAPVAQPTASGTGELDTIKKEALGELRPLVDKLNVSAEEKFDTYLLLIRSTDDRALIAPAHEAAKSITDEARRAQALLDIIKEIDYLSAEKTS